MKEHGNSNVVNFKEDSLELERMYYDLLMECESYLTKVNEKRVEEAMMVYEILSDMFKNNPNVRVWHDLHTPLKSMGSIRVSGENIVIRDVRTFLDIVSRDVQLHVVAFTNKNMELSIEFKDLMIMEGE